MHIFIFELYTEFIIFSQTRPIVCIITHNNSKGKRAIDAFKMITRFLFLLLDNYFSSTKPKVKILF